MKRIEKLMTICVSIMCMIIALSAVSPSVACAYTEEEKQAVKDWLISHGYPPTMAGAEQAYADYLAGRSEASDETENDTPDPAAEEQQRAEEQQEAEGQQRAEEPLPDEEIQKLEQEILAAKETEDAGKTGKEEIKKANDTDETEKAGELKEAKEAEEKRKAEKETRAAEEAKKKEEAEKKEAAINTKKEQKKDKEAVAAEEQSLSEAAQAAAEKERIQADQNYRANLIMLFAAMIVTAAGIGGTVFILYRRKPDGSDGQMRDVPSKTFDL